MRYGSVRTGRGSGKQQCDSGDRPDAENIRGSLSYLEYQMARLINRFLSGDVAARYGGSRQCKRKSAL